MRGTGTRALTAAMFDISISGRLLIGFAAGALIGSFLAVLAVRMPARRPVVAGRSACDSCGHPLGPLELVPLLSFLLLRGRCRHCGAPIPALLPLMEIAAGVVGAAVLAVAAGPTDLYWLLFGWLLLLLAALDLRHFWLPDSLTLTLAGLGLFSASLNHWPPVNALVGTGCGYLGLEAIRRYYRWRRGHDGMGGGDPKLFGAIGAWLGWQGLPLALTAAAMIGLMAVGVAALRGTAVHRHLRIPFGTCLALAAFLVWLTQRIGWLPD